jgi:hypothetical protein
MKLQHEKERNEQYMKRENRYFKGKRSLENRKLLRDKSEGDLKPIRTVLAQTTDEQITI